MIPVQQASLTSVYSMLCVISIATYPPINCNLSVINTIFNPDIVAPLSKTLTNNSLTLFAYFHMNTLIWSFPRIVFPLYMDFGPFTVQSLINTSDCSGYIDPIICCKHL